MDKVQGYSRDKVNDEGRDVWFDAPSTTPRPVHWKGWASIAIALVIFAASTWLLSSFGPRNGMKPTDVVAFTVVAVLVPMIGLYWVSRRHGPSRRDMPVVSITVWEIAQVLDAVRKAPAEPAFAALLFGTPDRPADRRPLNVQFSKHAGALGLDWVLLDRRNILDEGKFLAFAQARGYSPALQKQNGVKSLRMEGGDLAGFCEALLTELYKLPKTELLEMVYLGIEWPPSGST